MNKFVITYGYQSPAGPLDYLLKLHVLKNGSVVPMSGAIARAQRYPFRVAWFISRCLIRAGYQSKVVAVHE